MMRAVPTTDSADPATLDPAASPAVFDRLARRESSARSYAPRLPIVPVHAAGTTITADDGRTYLDCLAGAGALALGHNHPVVVEALKRALDAGIPLTTLDLSTPVKDAFTEALFELLPPALATRGRIHFCGPTGADAVEAALKLTQAATGRRGLLAFTGGYHGMTAGALAAMGNVAARATVSGAPQDVTRLPFPYPYRCPFGLGEAGVDVSLRYIERLISDPNGGVIPPAAMLLEPVQGEGGVVPAPDSWLESLRRLASARDVPLVVDEVQTGVGRTGAMWAVDHADVSPDVLVLSKAIGGGLPLAVVVYDQDLDVWKSGAHTGTFRGNQLAMAAGLATLQFVAENDLASRADSLGRWLLREFGELSGRFSTLGDVRGRGLMLGLEVVDPTQPADLVGAYPADPLLAQRIQAECLRRGLIVELGGRSDSVVRLLPPLTISDAEAAAVVERLAESWAAAEGAAAALPGSTVEGT